MGLAEPERGKGLEYLPDSVDGGRVEFEGEGPLAKPGFQLLLTGRRSHLPAHLVGQGQTDAGGDLDDLQHLFVEDDDAGGVLQHLLELGMQVFRVVPPPPSSEERVDHVGFDRAGPEQRDVDDQIEKGFRAELADEFTLAR